MKRSIRLLALPLLLVITLGSTSGCLKRVCVVPETADNTGGLCLPQ